MSLITAEIQRLASESIKRMEEMADQTKKLFADAKAMDLYAGMKEKVRRIEVEEGKLRRFVRSFFDGLKKAEYLCNELERISVIEGMLGKAGLYLKAVLQVKAQFSATESNKPELYGRILIEEYKLKEEIIDLVIRGLENFKKNYKKVSDLVIELEQCLDQATTGKELEVKSSKEITIPERIRPWEVPAINRGVSDTEWAALLKQAIVTLEKNKKDSIALSQRFSDWLSKFHPYKTKMQPGKSLMNSSETDALQFFALAEQVQEFISMSIKKIEENIKSCENPHWMDTVSHIEYFLDSTALRLKATEECLRAFETQELVYLRLFQNLTGISHVSQKSAAATTADTKDSTESKKAGDSKGDMEVVEVKDGVETKIRVESKDIKVAASGTLGASSGTSGEPKVDGAKILDRDRLASREQQLLLELSAVRQQMAGASSSLSLTSTSSTVVLISSAAQNSASHHIAARQQALSQTVEAKAAVGSDTVGKAANTNQ